MTAVLYLLPMMFAVLIILPSIFKMVRNLMSSKQTPWSGIIIQFIFGTALLYFSATKVLSHSKKADTEPTTTPIPEPHETLDTLGTSSDSDIIGYTLMAIAGTFLIVLVTVVIVRKIRQNSLQKQKLTPSPLSNYSNI